jgi:hypothetical protein
MLRKVSEGQYKIGPLDRRQPPQFRHGPFSAPFKCPAYSNARPIQMNVSKGFTPVCGVQPARRTLQILFSIFQYVTNLARFLLFVVAAELTKQT